MDIQASGDPNWAWLLHHNALDLRLYAYIEKLYEEQDVFVKGATENFRNVDTTCCRCELDGDEDDEIPYIASGCRNHCYLAVDSRQ